MSTQGVTHGISQQSFESLQTVVYVPEELADIENGTTRAFPTEFQTCSICLDPCDSGHGAIKELLCNHMFHEHCIQPWFGKNNVCPQCRYKVRG